MGLLPSSLVRLPDGSTLTVRAIHPGDSDLLLDHFAHLGADARYRRFLAPVHDLTAQEVDYFTHPDHRRHEALFALDDDGRPVGVARYISSAEHPRTAELAVAVVDGWRGRGVGRALVDELARRARQVALRASSRSCSRTTAPCAVSSTGSVPFRLCIGIRQALKSPSSSIP